MLTTDNTRLNASAHQKLLTVKLVTRLLTKRIRSAFKTKVNKPNESTLMGSVRMSSSGFNSVLMSPKTIATKSAVRKSGIWTPEARSHPVMYTESALTMSETIIPMQPLLNTQGRKSRLKQM